MQETSQGGDTEMGGVPSTGLPAAPTPRGEVRRVTQEIAGARRGEGGKATGCGPWRLQKMPRQMPDRAARARTESSSLDLAIVPSALPSPGSGSMEEEAGLLVGGTSVRKSLPSMPPPRGCSSFSNLPDPPELFQPGNLLGVL